MAYEKQTWACGDTITAEKLNHMEDGIAEVGIETNIQNPTDGQTLKYDAESGKWVNGEGGSGPLVVTATEDNDAITLDHTWQEIHDAFPNVELVSADGEREFILRANIEDDVYNVFIMSAGASEPIISIYSTDFPTDILPFLVLVVAITVQSVNHIGSTPMNILHKISYDGHE